MVDARTLVAILVALLSMSAAQAEPTIVSSESEFLVLAGNVTREGFESFPTDTGCATGGSSPTSTVITEVFSVTSNPQDGGTSFLCVGTSTPAPPGPTEGNNALVAGSNTGDSFILEFSLGESAKGFYFELTDAVERGDAYLLVEGLDPILIASQGSGGLTNILFGVVLDSPVDSFSIWNTGRFDGWGVDNLILADATQTIAIDIKPGSDPNCFNANGHGLIPVAILGSESFDVTTIDQTTLLFGGLEVRVRGKKGPLCGFEDSNGDAYTDLVCHFEDDAESWDPGDGEATLSGNLFDSTEFEGTDAICVVP